MLIKIGITEAYTIRETLKRDSFFSSAYKPHYVQMVWKEKEKKEISFI